MALKRLLTEEEYNKLPDTLKAEYSKSGDDYELSIVGGWEDTTALKNAKDHEKRLKEAALEEKNTFKKQLEEITAERDKLLREGNIPEDRLKRIQETYDQKIAKLEKESGEKVASYRQQLVDIHKTAVASNLAKKISTDPEIMEIHLLQRITAEDVDGKVVTRIKDAEGKVNPALTIEDLQKEFVANKTFKRILIGSQGSGGGGAPPDGNGGGGAPPKVDFTKSPKQIAADLKNSGRLQERS